MYFKKLEIFGFKSFADKTTLNFGPGITAVIGPNGCGKSNVFDAIRWVLGEQSVRELRGSSMEDVIFNGTDKKMGLGFAEVSLTFTNDTRMLPIDYDEVTITRRLFRSGESEYLLNKTQVRLKDIVELFMGTGIGAESYSLVQQGKVDLVVSAKPEDRRMILDEASGVIKYKAKRKEALSKLKDTDNNLLRINDIVVEVKRQIASSERQAKKARRYKGEFEKLKQLEVRLANHELSQFTDKHQHLQIRLRELQEKEKGLTSQLNESNERLARENSLLEELENKINENSAQEIKLEAHLDIHNRQIGFNEERMESIASHEKRIGESKKQLLERCRTHSEKIEEVKQALLGLDETIKKNEEDLEAKRNYLNEIAASINEANTAIQYEEKETLGMTSNQVNVNNRLTEVMKEAQVALARKRRLEMENAKVTNEKGESDEKLTNVKAKIESSNGRMADLKRASDANYQTLKKQTTELAALEQEISFLEKKKLLWQSQKEFIEKLHTQYQDIPDPVVEGRLFINTAPMDHHTGIIGKVKEVLPVGPSEYQIICETKFIELDPQQISTQIEQLNNQTEEKIMRKNELIAGVKKQRQVISQIKFEIQEEEKFLSIHEAQRKGIVGESDKLQEELELIRIEMEETNDSLSALHVTEDDLKRQVDRLNQDLELSQFKIDEKKDWITLESKEREETSVAIAQLETEKASFDDKRQDHEGNTRMFIEAMNNSLDEMKRLEDESTELKQKKEKFVLDTETCREKIVQTKEERASLQDAGSGYVLQKDEVDQKVNSIRASITAIGGEIDEIKNNIHDQQFNEQDVAFKEKEIKDRLLQTYKIDLETINENKGSTSGREFLPVIASEQSERSNLDGIASSPMAPRNDNPQLVSKDNEQDIVNPDEWRDEIEKVRKRCDAFGAVNLVAIEEFEELRERFEFLTKQQSDLIEAKESLHQTIRKINRQTRQMFMDTFTRVSEEFRIYYRMLFGGGDAQLVLLDPENVLESGIEIVARPPGKKLQNISLLSGGEKALTAIALIFGVFKVNPSPFCVLDEIDAALDESNVGRFSYLLKDFAKIAQFIVITHNKKTIASADVMYGITMQETGVSKIVSVKFSDDKEKDPQKEDTLVGV